MTFGERVVGALKLEESAFEDVERDPSAIGQAVGVIVLGSVSTGIGWIAYGGLSHIVSGAFTSLLGVLLGSVIIWLVGTKLMPGPATQADFPQTFRTLGFAAAPTLAGFVTIIPILGWLLWMLIVLWQIAAAVVAVKAVLDYTDIGKAIIVVLISAVITWCLAFFLVIPLIGLRMMFG
jgi:hypothetical protein